jgi:hypothetical protein
MMGSFAIQAMMIVLVALLISLRLTSHIKQPPELKKQHLQLVIGSNTKDQFPWLDLLPVALLSFQSAGQLYISRVVKKPTLQTMVLTAIYCDTLSGLCEQHGERPTNNHAQLYARIASILSLFSGVLVGGALGKMQDGFAGTLWLAAGLKMLIVCSWYFWPSVRLQEGKEHV